MTRGEHVLVDGDVEGVVERVRDGFASVRTADGTARYRPVEQVAECPRHEMAKPPCDPVCAKPSCPWCIVARLLEEKRAREAPTLPAPPDEDDELDAFLATQGDDDDEEAAAGQRTGGSTGGGDGLRGGEEPTRGGAQQGGGDSSHAGRDDGGPPADTASSVEVDDELPEGARGIGRQRRKGDPKKKYLQSRRPKPDDAEGWIDYRTQVRVAFNEAERDGATELMTWFREEHERAMAVLEELKPGFASRFFAQDQPTPDSAKPAKGPKVRKPRATPALDRACLAIRELQQASLDQAWSPVRLRNEIQRARDACKSVWRRAVLKVFGVGVLELPDTRQMFLFPDSEAA